MQLNSFMTSTRPLKPNRPTFLTGHTGRHSSTYFEQEFPMCEGCALSAECKALDITPSKTPRKEACFTPEKSSGSNLAMMHYLSPSSSSEESQARFVYQMDEVVRM
jgi:hypothetical protein